MMMALKRIGCFVLGALLGSSLVNCRKSSNGEAQTTAGAHGSDSETIQVGLIASLTGKFSALGSEDKKAVELAIEQVNAKGGLLGKKLTLVTRDD